MDPFSDWVYSGKRDITMYIIDPAQGKGRHSNRPLGNEWDVPDLQFEATHSRRLLLSILLRHQKSQVFPFSFCIYEGDVGNFWSAWDYYLRHPEIAAETLVTVDPSILDPEAKAKELLGMVRMVHHYTLVKVRNSAQPPCRIE